MARVPGLGRSRRRRRGVWGARHRGGGFCRSARRPGRRSIGGRWAVHPGWRGRRCRRGLPGFLGDRHAFPVASGEPEHRVVVAREPGEDMDFVTAPSEAATEYRVGPQWQTCYGIAFGRRIDDGGFGALVAELEGVRSVDGAPKRSGRGESMSGLDQESKKINV